MLIVRLGVRVLEKIRRLARQRVVRLVCYDRRQRLVRGY